MSAQFTSKRFPMHAHDSFVIAFTDGGGSCFRSNRSSGEVKRKQFLVFNPWEAHAGWLGRSKDWSYRAIYVYDDAVEQLKQRLRINGSVSFSNNLILDDQLHEEFSRLHHSFEMNTDFFAQRENLYAAFNSLFLRYGHVKTSETIAQADEYRLRLAKEFIHDRYAEKLTIEEVAAEIDLSCFQMIKLFQKSMGITPYAYLTQVRLCRAIQLIKQGVSLSSAALDTGFYDQSALTNHLKRCYAITPSQLR
ncbi:AraC-type DNA-binding protein [Aliiroseovarius crassostreae]|nr:AraC family transcriptional regulator [Aliiroseovarius crassostreae]SFU91991.1 AraC-type DNA-binding protein [Aliiroseovarius crassostreae]